MTQNVPPRPVVAIVGGGYTGASVAYHLASHGPGFEIVVIEPRPMLGAGLAYSTEEPTHRINVPAHRMSMLSSQPSHFADWLAASGLVDDDPDAFTSEGRIFPRRAAFGRYVHEQLAGLVERGIIAHRRDRAVAIERTGRHFSIRLAGGERLQAAIVVLAMTHPAPKVPAMLREAAGWPGFVPDVYVPGALDGIGRDDAVLVVGNGLTAADTIAALDARGHRGDITALSRRGIRSRGHAAVSAEPYGDFTTVPTANARLLLKRVRAAVVAAEREGITWHAVVDALRDQARTIWQALDPAERIRVVRHLRVFWDAHRFRVAPQIEAVTDRRLRERTLAIVAGSLQAVAAGDGRFQVTYRPRHRTAAMTASFDAIVVTTGPEHAAVMAQNPALASLATAGLLRIDPTGLGLETTGNGRAVGADGMPAANLFIAGPLARGTVGELMGLTQVTRNVEMVAGEIAQLQTIPARLAG